MDYLIYWIKIYHIHVKPTWTANSNKNKKKTIDSILLTNWDNKFCVSHWKANFMFLLWQSK